MSKKLKKTVESTIHSAGKAVEDVKKQVKHYSTKKTARPQYQVVRGRLGATYLVVTCASCGKDIGKRPLTDQAFKPGNTWMEIVGLGTTVEELEPGSWKIRFYP